jgi:hypothetical protein
VGHIVILSSDDELMAAAGRVPAAEDAPGAESGEGRRPRVLGKRVRKEKKMEEVPKCRGSHPHISLIQNPTGFRRVATTWRVSRLSTDCVAGQDSGQGIRGAQDSWRVS